MWKLCIEDDEANRTEVNLIRDVYSVGRDASNAIRLTERNISRKHAVVEHGEHGWTLRDLNSYNGCYVNGARVSGEQALAPNDLIQIGDYRIEVVEDLTIQVQGVIDKRTIPATPQTRGLRDLSERLVMLAGPTPGATFHLRGKRVVIGRGEECDIAINDTSVSRVHAELLPMGDGRYELLDRNSSNGVRVNGVALERALLDAGDVVELGDVRTKFIAAGQIYHWDPRAGDGLAGHALEPGTDASGLRRSRSALMIAGVTAAGLLGLVVLLALRRGEDPSGQAAHSTHQATKSPAELALEAARALADRGDLEGARTRAEQVPEDSNLRASDAFKEVLAQWADALFEQAGRTTDPGQKRALLGRIAGEQSLDSVRRKRAANELAALDAPTDEIIQLPSTAAPAATRDAEATQGEPAPEPKRARPSAAPPTPTQQASARTTTTAPAPRKQSGRDVKGGLVRDDPF